MFFNTTGVDSNAQVCGSNEVQLGDYNTLLYCFGSGVISRSDVRDKAEIRDTRLGLDFICALHPVDYKWDMREDYRSAAITAAHGNPGTDAAVSYKLSSYEHDGSRTRTRYHHGLIAQEVKAAVSGLGDSEVNDFGGFQDHTVRGGDDVLSLGYIEFMAPLIKSVQDLRKMVQALQTQVQTLQTQVQTHFFRDSELVTLVP